jgi:hypothetical protein
VVFARGGASGGTGTLDDPYGDIDDAVNAAIALSDGVTVTMVVSLGGLFTLEAAGSRTVPVITVPLAMLSLAQTQIDVNSNGVLWQIAQANFDDGITFAMDAVTGALPRSGWFLFSALKYAIPITINGDGSIPVRLREVWSLNGDIVVSRLAGTGICDMRVEGCQLEDLNGVGTVGSTFTRLSYMHRSSFATAVVDEIGSVQDSNFTDLAIDAMVANLNGKTDTYNDPVGIYRTNIITSLTGNGGGAGTVQLVVDRATRNLYRNNSVVPAAEFGDGSGGPIIVIAEDYQAAAPANWGGAAPTTIEDALDRIAAALGPIP